MDAGVEVGQAQDAHRSDQREQGSEDHEERSEQVPDGGHGCGSLVRTASSIFSAP